MDSIAPRPKTDYETILECLADWQNNGNDSGARKKIRTSLDSLFGKSLDTLEEPQWKYLILETNLQNFLQEEAGSGAVESRVMPLWRCHQLFVRAEKLGLIKQLFSFCANMGEIHANIYLSSDADFLVKYPHLEKAMIYYSFALQYSNDDSQKNNIVASLRKFEFHLIRSFGTASWRAKVEQAVETKNKELLDQVWTSFYKTVERIKRFDLLSSHTDDFIRDELYEYMMWDVEKVFDIADKRLQLEDLLKRPMETPSSDREEYKKLLKEARTSLEEGATLNFTANQTKYNEKIQKLLALIVQHAVWLLGPPPHDFSFVVLGSYAKGMGLPSSDVEITIYVAPGCTDFQYFNQLFHLVAAKVYSINEPYGFRLDGDAADVPEEMRGLTQETLTQKLSCAPNVEGYTTSDPMALSLLDGKCVIEFQQGNGVGNSNESEYKVFAGYQEALREHYMDSNFQGTQCHKERAAALFRKFNRCLTKPEEQEKASTISGTDKGSWYRTISANKVDIKKNFLQPITAFVQTLALYRADIVGLCTGKSPIEIIGILSRYNIIPIKLAEKLVEAINFLQYQRYVINDFYKQQNASENGEDDMPKETDMGYEQNDVAYLDDSHEDSYRANRKTMYDIYLDTVLPISLIISKFNQAPFDISAKDFTANNDDRYLALFNMLLDHISAAKPPYDSNFLSKVERLKKSGRTSDALRVKLQYLIAFLTEPAQRSALTPEIKLMLLAAMRGLPLESFEGELFADVLDNEKLSQIVLEAKDKHGKPTIKKLSLHNCPNVTAVITETETALQRVDIKNCPALKKVDLIAPKLEVLSLQHCESLVSVNLQERSEVSAVTVRQCNKLNHLMVKSPYKKPHIIFENRDIENQDIRPASPMYKMVDPKLLPKSEQKNLRYYKNPQNYLNYNIAVITAAETAAPLRIALGYKALSEALGEVPPPGASGQNVLADPGIFFSRNDRETLLDFTMLDMPEYQMGILELNANSNSAVIQEHHSLMEKCKPRVIVFAYKLGSSQAVRDHFLACARSLQIQNTKVIFVVYNDSPNKAKQLLSPNDYDFLQELIMTLGINLRKICSDRGINTEGMTPELAAAFGIPFKIIPDQFIYLDSIHTEAAQKFLKFVLYAHWDEPELLPDIYENFPEFRDTSAAVIDSFDDPNALTKARGETTPNAPFSVTLTPRMVIAPIGNAIASFDNARPISNLMSFLRPLVRPILPAPLSTMPKNKG